MKPIIIAQIPVPTPTLLPTHDLPINLTIIDDMSMWDFAPNAVQFWNMSNRDGFLTFLQVVVFFFVVGVCLMLLVNIINRRITDDDE